MELKIEDTIAAIIADTAKESMGADVAIAHDQSLIDSGILDSLSIIKVIKALQSEFSIEISGGDITLDNFDTIDAIVNFVHGRME
jgi:acyl carrier protein